MPANYDFCGWATKNDLVCSDGRVIRRDAFKECDGKTVPMVWNHQHDDPDSVLGHALLKNVPDKGVIAYGSFNNTPKGQQAKELVGHGDIVSLSIYANHLRQNGPDVVHGQIKEVSLVLAGANPGAYIETVLTHADGTDDEEEGVIRCGIEGLELMHADDDKADDGEESDSKEEEGETVEDVLNTLSEKQMNAVTYLITQALKHSDEDESKEDNSGEMSHEDNDDETVGDVFDTLTDKQKKAVYALIEAAQHSDIKSTEEDNDEMKHNLFEGGQTAETNYISHADQVAILKAAKDSRTSFRDVLRTYVDENVLQHDDEPDKAPVSGFEDEYFEYLFPDYKDVRPGAPELVTYDQGWVNVVMNKTHKMPFSRIRTRQNDIRAISDLRAKGYDKGDKKALSGNYQLIHRTTDPQTVYVKSALNRDDIIDITDFDYVAYQYQIDRLMLNEELAMAVMLGDGRADDSPDKISPDKIRPIWTDDELYTIHVDIDTEAMAEELQGTDTNAYFGENFIYAESIVTALLYARENYKGSGKPDFFCDPHLLNVMLLARDRTGHRMYSDASDVAKALNVGNIYTAEQFAGKTRTSGTGASTKYHKLLGIMVNLDDYKVGATKGGQITHFNQFDIDFNQEKSLIETRLSGALDRIKSAIVLEEEVENP